MTKTADPPNQPVSIKQPDMEDSPEQSLVQKAAEESICDNEQSKDSNSCQENLQANTESLPNEEDSKCLYG